jgi:hypothetical protein
LICIKGSERSRRRRATGRQLILGLPFHPDPGQHRFEGFADLAMTLLHRCGDGCADGYEVGAFQEQDLRLSSPAQ